MKEWGCMQALIDFDGWRKWKDFTPQNEDASGSGAKGLLTAKNHARKGSASGKTLRREKRRSDSSNLAGQLPSTAEQMQTAEAGEAYATQERGPKTESRRSSGSEKPNGITA